MLAEKPPILERMTALADALRSRILLLLEEQELTVSEICAVTQLPQSTVSRHLKILSEGDWLVSRPHGTSRFYGFPAEGSAQPSDGELWALIREEIAATPSAREDRARLREVLRERREKSRRFFSASAGEWDRLRDELFGERSYHRGMLALLDERWQVADLGCGTGRVSEALAPFVAGVVAIDASTEMLDSARLRLADLPNVELRQGELEALPLADDSVDAATLVLVLHHLPHPAQVLREVARVLRPGGRLLLIDMLPHERVEYQQEMGHVWLGFEPERVERLAREAGLTGGPCFRLPADPAARGPRLFSASYRLDDNVIPEE